MKNLFLSIILLFVICLTGCSEDDPIPQPKPEAFSRTVLAYMVASNLGGNLTANIDSMISVATSQNLNNGNLLVFYSKNQNQAELFEIKEGENGTITRHHIRDYVGQSAISPEVMQSVIQEVVSEFPADGYGLILSSHGTSWLPQGYNRLRSFGEENGKNMEIYDLAKGLTGLEIPKFDFILIDACSMGSVEVMYELKDNADYIISSAAEIISTGFPFDQVVPHLFEETLNLDQVAQSFFNFYNNYIYPYGCVSVTNTAALDELATITGKILTSAGLEGIYSLPLSEIQILSDLPSAPSALYDFDHLISYLATPEQLTVFKAALQRAVISKYTTERVICSSRYVTVNHHSGLSIYPLQERLPQLNEWYRTNLQWSKAVLSGIAQ